MIFDRLLDDLNKIPVLAKLLMPEYYRKNSATITQVFLKAPKRSKDA
jgi:hypothetical protein